MKNILLFAVLLWLNCSVFAQINGNAKLVGVTNFSGIKVIFNAVSLTAVTDSTISDISGNYSKILAAGTYTVQFKKDGFNTLNYFEPVFVNGSISLQNVQLSKVIVKQVSGNVKGIWSKDTVYSIIDKITIPYFDSLIIMPGVKIQLNHDVADFGILVSVYGKLRMKGNVNDSIFVLPSTKADYTKNMISFIALNNSVFEYISCKNSIFNIENSPTIKVVANSLFQGLGMSLSGVNEVFNNKTTRHIYFFGSNSSEGKSHIHCNQFISIDLASPFSHLYVSTNSVVHSLDVHDNSFIFGQNSLPSFDLVTNDTSKVVFTNNYIVNYPDSINFTHNGASLDFSNNTVYNADNNHYSSIKISGKYTNLKVTNNIFGNNLFKVSKPNPIFNFTKNQFSNKAIFVNMAGAGVPISTNAQGSKTDTYLNVIEDPKFSTVPLLRTSSPMKGAGVNGTTIGYDPKGTCLEDFFSEEPITIVDELDQDFLKSSVFPIPFCSQLSVTNKTSEQVSIINVTGKEVFKGTGEKLDIDTQLWPSGMYFVKINQQIFKIVKE